MARLTVRLGMVLAAAVLAIFGTLPSARTADTDLRAKILAFNDVTGEDTVEGEIKILADDPAAAKNLLAAALPMVKEKPQPLNFNAAYILARTAQNLNDLDSGRIFYHLCIDQARKLKSSQLLANSYQGLLQLLSKNKKYEETVQVCKEILEMDEEEGQMRRLKSAVLQLVIQAMAEQGKTDEALKLVDNLLKARPDDWRYVELKALVLREGGQNAEAAKTYETLLELIEKDHSLKKDEKDVLTDTCRYILSGVYVDLNNIDKAQEELQTLLSKNPNNPTYNNDLGYIWADHDQNLADSEKLIRKAIEEERKQRKKDPDLKPEDDKDNAAYLDSLGWVLYKEKKYKEARDYLEQAVQDKEEGQSCDILDHLGDVYKALGDKEKAVQTWKKALDSPRKSKREEKRKAQVEKKLKEYEVAGH